MSGSANPQCLACLTSNQALGECCTPQGHALIPQGQTQQGKPHKGSCAPPSLPGRPPSRPTVIPACHRSWRQLGSPELRERLEASLVSPRTITLNRVTYCRESGQAYQHAQGWEVTTCALFAPILSGFPIAWIAAGLMQSAGGENKASRCGGTGRFHLLGGDFAC